VLDLELLASLQGIQDGDAKTWGIDVGRAAAQVLLAVRAHDGSDRVVDYTPGTDPGDWQPTPPAYLPALAPQWPGVTPFCLQSAAQFRVPPPPALDSPEYTAALDLTRTLGEDNSTNRTADETEAAIFWQGIATPNATQMSIWNDITQAVALSQGTTLVQNARLFALLDLAAGDFAIACWDSKYTYNLWRPVTAIRSYGIDPDWTPLMPTPNHPSYPAAHGSLSGTAATVLATFFGTDEIPFSVSWEGFPGVTRSFDSFSSAAQEAGMSRIWAGFHYSFDVSAGLAQGQAIGNYIASNFLLPRGPVPGHWAIGLPTPAAAETAALAGLVNPCLPAPSANSPGLPGQPAPHGVTATSSAFDPVHAPEAPVARSAPERASGLVGDPVATGTMLLTDLGSQAAHSSLE
jgi:membrane-associated phospholipid phosphatase